MVSSLASPNSTTSSSGCDFSFMVNSFRLRLRQIAHVFLTSGSLKLVPMTGAVDESVLMLVKVRSCVATTSHGALATNVGCGVKGNEVVVVRPRGVNRGEFVRSGPTPNEFVVSAELGVRD